MNKLSDDERNPLRYYAETERIIHGPVRGTIIQGPVQGTVRHHLLDMGYIEERTVDTRGAVVVLTAAGRRALLRPPCELSLLNAALRSSF
jgi:hypothetical protein